MTKILITVILLSTTSIASAASWNRVSESDERTFYLNTDSLKRNGNIVSAWTRSVIHTDLTKDGMSVGDYTQLRYIFNCKENTVTSDFYIEYKASGKVINSESIQFPKYAPIIPDSIGEAVFETVCNAI